MLDALARLPQRPILFDGGVGQLPALFGAHGIHLLLVDIDETDKSHRLVLLAAVLPLIERALAAQASGIDGVICSGQEAGMIRAATGPGFSIVCPGIRPGGPVGDDQKRTVGVAEAFALGADVLSLFAIFTALAVGMAFPWLIVAAFPQVAGYFPKPGRWMNTGKRLRNNWPPTSA